MENSIEEDIKDIEKYISFTSKRENFSYDTDWNCNKDLANKIKHILSDYKRVLKENEKYKRLTKMNLKNAEEFKDNMCDHRCLLKSENEELKARLDELSKNNFPIIN